MKPWEQSLPTSVTLSTECPNWSRSLSYHVDFKFTGHIIVPRQPTQFIAFYESILMDNDAQRTCLVPHQAFKWPRRKRSPDEIKNGTKESSCALPICKCQLPSLYFRRRWGWETLLSEVPPFFTDAQISLIVNWRHTTLTYSGIHSFPSTLVPW